MKKKKKKNQEEKPEKQELNKEKQEPEIPEIEELYEDHKIEKKDLIISGIIFLSSFLFYCITSSRTISFGDSGEFVYASYNLDILHPPGYPLYSILGKIFTLLPVGTVPFRVNMMSAFFGALTLVFLYLILKYITKNIPASLTGVLCLLFSSTFWYYSHYAKGYVINLFFLSLLIYCSLRYRENVKWFYLWGFLFGLSCTYHYQSTIILIPAFLYIFLITKIPRIKDVLITTLLLILPLSLYLFLPLKALSAPDDYHWGNPSTISGFIEIVTGKIYGWHDASSRSGITNTIFQIGMYGKFLIKEFNILGIVLGVYGAVIMGKRYLHIFLFTLIMYLANILAVSYLITTEVDLFLEAILPGLFLPAHLIFAIWIGIAIFSLSEKIKKPYLIYLFLLIPIFSLCQNFQAGYQRNNFMAYDFANNCFALLEEDSILITSGDNDTFPLWYLQKVENVRTDVKVITMGLIGEKNYEKYLRTTLKIPWDEELYTGLSPENTVMTFIGKNRDKKIYLTFHAAAQLPPDLIIAPRGILYEAVEPDELKDLTICSELINEKYSIRGLTDKKVYKDFLNSSMTGPYGKAFYDLGELYLKSGDTKKAMECIKVIENIDYGIRKDIKEEFQKAADFQKAKIASLEENWDETLKLLSNAEDLVKNTSEFYIIRASAYRGKMQYVKAIEDLNNALQITPKSPDINLEMGKICYDAGDIQEAIFKFSIAIQLKKDIFEGHYWLGKSYEKYNLPDKAIEEYKKELKFYPDHKPSQVALEKLQQN